ncbi:MAG: hypothetical protein V9F04_11125 [Dermatophilaceae bacterium]
MTTRTTATSSTTSDLFNSLRGGHHRLHQSGALDGYEKKDIEGLLDRPHREGSRRPR